MRALDGLHEGRQPAAKQARAPMPPKTDSYYSVVTVGERARGLPWPPGSKHESNTVQQHTAAHTVWKAVGGSPTRRPYTEN